MMIPTHRPIARREFTKLLARGVSAVAFAAAGVLLASPARAGTFTVTNTYDSSTGSLRQATTATGPGGNTSEFSDPAGLSTI